MLSNLIQQKWRTAAEGENCMSNRLNLTFEPCYCLTQHVMRSYNKCMRAQVTWKVLYDRIAIIEIYLCLITEILFLVCSFAFVSPIP